MNAKHHSSSSSSSSESKDCSSSSSSSSSSESSDSDSSSSKHHAKHHHKHTNENEYENGEWKWGFSKMSTREIEDLKQWGKLNGISWDQMKAYNSYYKMKAKQGNHHERTGDIVCITNILFCNNKIN